MKEKRLFVVEFGKPDGGRYVSFGGGIPEVYVIATSYDEAANKALMHTEAQIAAKGILDSDGSLNQIAKQEPIQVKSVKLVCEELIW